MLTHLIILLDDMSVSYCHYNIERTENRLISLENLQAGIIYAMKENLSIQFVYPKYELPIEYKEAIDSIDHAKIGPESCGENLDVVVVHKLDFYPDKAKSYLWRCSLDTFVLEQQKIISILPKVIRFSIVLTDIPTWKDNEFLKYKEALENIAEAMAEHYQKGETLQLNLLTDRIMLGKMNNCNAGDTNITLGPDGYFYICPAYYPHTNIGSLRRGLRILNKQLYRLDHAPICRNCDAYQCKRCIWMNEKITLDCNTPSHEQCIAAHLERNASCKLLQMLKSNGVTLEDFYEIKDINYLDPFINLNRCNTVK